MNKVGCPWCGGMAVSRTAEQVAANTASDGSHDGETAAHSHVRTHPADVEAAVKAGFDGLNFYMGTSEQSRAHNHGRDLAGIAASAR